MRSCPRSGLPARLSTARLTGRRDELLERIKVELNKLGPILDMGRQIKDRMRRLRSQHICSCD